MTAPENWPDFLIIGAAKSGTTSLYAYLKRHPQVFLPEMKELNYFAPTHPFGVHDREGYLAALARGAQCIVTGEASPAYLSSDESPGLIHETLGDRVRLLVLLRNPVDMMYSHWAHCVRDALEHRDAERALLESFDQAWDPAKWYLHHAWRAQYTKQLARYFALFPRENFRIFLFEEFFVPGLPQFNEVCRFLGVADFDPGTREAHNKGSMPRSRMLHRFINVYYGRYCLSVARKLVPGRLRRAVRRRLDAWNAVGEGQVPPLPAELRAKLEERLGPGVRELETMLGRDLSRVWF